MDEFFKFPSTPHLALFGDIDIRTDKVMSKFECNEFLINDLVVEEKVDGANLGISFDKEGGVRAQNRGSYLQFPATDQWKKLEEWISSKINILFDTLTDRLILFGEWCYAQHSIFYDHLPDWFLGFDIYDKKNIQFLSSALRNDCFKKMGIAQVPAIATGCFNISELKNLLTESKLSGSPAEGLYLRLEHGEWLKQRAKLVRPAFIQSVEQHWSRSGIKPNRLIMEIKK